MLRGTPARWSDEEDQLLRDLWAKGFTAGQISLRLSGRSRNSCIGRLHRLGCSKRGTTSTRPIYRKPTKRLSPSQRRKFSPRINPTPNYTPQPRLESELRAIAALPPIDPSLDVLKLSTFTCRYPIGHPDREGFAFCGRTCDAEDSYCGSHRRLCYQPGTAAKPVRTVPVAWREGVAR